MPLLFIVLKLFTVSMFPNISGNHWKCFKLTWAGQLPAWYTCWLLKLCTLNIG